MVNISFSLVIIMVVSQLLVVSSVSLARSLLNGSLLPLPHFRRNHPYLEQQSLGLDAAAHLIQIVLRQRRRAGRDVDEHALQLIEHGSHRRVAGLQRGLPIQPIGRDQLLRARLLGRDVHLASTSSALTSSTSTICERSR